MIHHVAGMSLNTFLFIIVYQKKKRQITSEHDNRIVVEHVFGWLDKYRRIILRSHSFKSFHYLFIFLGIV
jgi:hypothetical protein